VVTGRTVTSCNYGRYHETIHVGGPPAAATDGVANRLASVATRTRSSFRVGGPLI
jgi:hypothetical protein